MLFEHFFLCFRGSPASCFSKTVSRTVCVTADTIHPDAVLVSHRTGAFYPPENQKAALTAVFRQVRAAVKLLQKAPENAKTRQVFSPAGFLYGMASLRGVELPAYRLGANFGSSNPCNSIIIYDQIIHDGQSFLCASAHKSAHPYPAVFIGDLS